MDNLTAILVVKGKPAHLLESVKSVATISSEIIIADIGIDQTSREAIKKINNVKFITIKEAIPYVELLREKLKDHVSNEYILFLDPDESVPHQLISFIKNNIGQFDYLRIPRKNIIFGKWIQHARWWPDYQIRLFRKDKVSWPTKIHSQPKTLGVGLTVEAKVELAIVHHNYETIDDYFLKMVRYAKAEAQDFAKNDKSLTLTDTVNYALSEFISRFFAEKGFLDGIHGFILSVMQMFNYFFVYFYYWELKGKPETQKADLITSTEFFFKKGFKVTTYWLIKEKLVKPITALKYKLINKLLS